MLLTQVLTRLGVLGFLGLRFFGLEVFKPFETLCFHHERHKLKARRRFSSCPTKLSGGFKCYGIPLVNLNSLRRLRFGFPIYPVHYLTRVKETGTRPVHEQRQG